MAPSSPWEHLQSVLMSTYNRVVRDEFSDVADDDGFATPRASLKTACLVEDSDSILQANMRMMLFYFVLRKASDLQAPIYGTPTDTYQQSVKFRPQIRLYFLEDREDVEEGYSPIDAEVTFRLANETSGTINEAQATTIANRIRAEFCTAGGYRWRKGRVKVSYKDTERGYSMIISAFNEAEGREVITKVLSIQNHPFDESNMTISNLSAAPPIVPPTEQIYGRARRTPRKRPIGHVRFRHAELHVWGLPNAVTLVDRTNTRRTALVRA